MTATAPTDTDGVVGAPASAAAAAAPSAPPEADFLQRAKDNPQWASDQIKAFQSRADSAEAKNQKLVDQIGPAMEFIERVDGKTIKDALDNYSALRNSQQFGETILEYERTRQLPARKGSEPKDDDVDEEYKTPEEREMQSLRQEVAVLRQDTSANTLASGKEMMTKHMARVFEEHGFVPEDVEKLSATMTTQIDSWALQGDKGLSALKSLWGPGGYSTVKGILLGGAPPEAFQRAAENLTLRKQKGLSALGTDGPSGALTTGQEAPSEFASAREAAKYFAAHPDQNPSR